MTLGNITACTPKPNGPEPTAEQFFAALATGDTAAAAELSDRPADARQALNDAWAGLQATHLDAQILSSKYAEDTGSVTYRYTWHLPKDRTWTYDGQLNLVRDEGRWEVRWSTTGLHPKLGENQTLALRADPPRRASVNERSGSDVLVPGYLYNFSLDAQAAGGALMPTARAVVDALRPFDNTLDPQLLAEQASSSKQRDESHHPAPVRPRPGGRRDRDTSRGGDHGAGRTAADRRDVRTGHRRGGQEGGGRRTRRPGGMAGGQRQPERRRRRRTQRGAGRTRAFRDDQPGPCRAERRPGRRQHHRQAGDDRGDQAVHRRDPRRRAEPGRRCAGDARHDGPLSARVDVQDDHRGRRHRTRHGHTQHVAAVPRHDGHRPPHRAQLRRFRPRHRADVAGVRQFVQHHLRRTGQPDAAARADDGRREVRHRDGLHDRGSTP